jgi:mannosyltransferase OCH1-like enzyme
MNVAHFIWFQGTPPAKYITTINNFQMKNPNFNINIWSEKTLLPLLNRNHIFYNSIKKCKYMIQKIDIYKYIVLFYFGGIYLDLDINIEASFTNNFLNDLNQYDLVFSKIKMIEYLPINLINNGIIFGKKGSPLLLKIVEDINWDQPFYKTKDWIVLDTAGPLYVTRWCKENNIQTIDQKYVEGRPLFYIFNSDYKGVFITHLHHNNWMDSYLYLVVLFINYSLYTIIFICILYLLYNLQKIRNNFR